MWSNLCLHIEQQRAQFIPMLLLQRGELDGLIFLLLLGLLAVLQSMPHQPDRWQ